MLAFTLEGKYISTTAYYKLIVEITHDVFQKLKTQLGKKITGDELIVPISAGAHPRVQLTMPKRLRDEKMMPKFMPNSLYTFHVHWRPWKYDGKTGCLLMFDGVASI